MKGSIIFVSCILYLVSFVGLVMAVESTPSGAGTASGQVDNKAKEILNKVSDQVAALASKQRQVYEGKIKSVGTSSVMVTTTDSGDKSITTNEVTTYFRIRAGNRTTLNFSGLKVGDDIASVGSIDPATGEMTAKQIIAKIQRQNVVGNLDTLDKGIASVSDATGAKTKVDLNSAITLLKSDSKNKQSFSSNKQSFSSNKIATAKLTDFQAGNTVFAIGYISDSAETLSVLKALTL